MSYRLVLRHVIDLTAQGGGGAHLDGSDGIVGSEEAGVGKSPWLVLLVGPQ